jgi:hypothetical protein
MFVVTGAVLMVVGFELSSASAFVGLLLLLFALLTRAEASYCRAADHLTAAHWEGLPGPPRIVCRANTRTWRALNWLFSLLVSLLSGTR